MVVAVALMVLGALDPMEGAVVIAAGTLLLAVAARASRSPFTSWAWTASALVVVGVAALFWMSALGGVGGTSGRSIWWLLAAAPYPLGWVLGLVTAFRMRHAFRPA